MLRLVLWQLLQHRVSVHDARAERCAGKSHLLKQLKAKANAKKSQQMKVLYLCAREHLLAADYPAPTRWLTRFLLEASNV